MTRAPLLDLWLHLTERSEGQAIAALAADGQGGALAERTAERMGRASAARVPGPLIWLRAGRATSAEALAQVARRLAEERPELGFVLTHSEAAFPPAGRLPPRCACQVSPVDARIALDRFLDHWQPDLVLVAGALPGVRLLRRLARRGVPVVAVDVVMERAQWARWRWWPGRARALLQPLAALLAADADSAARLRLLGAAGGAVTVPGRLHDEAEPPPCDDRARQRMAARLEGRPVWLASDLAEAEETALIEAHRVALGSVLRLLLVIAPEDPARGPGLAAALRAAGWRVARRAAEEMPSYDTSVVIADVPAEQGLWLRLAPVCFAGGTLGGAVAMDPWPAAALGSAVLHGPDVVPRAVDYAALDRVGGARLVADSRALAATLPRALQPQEAARMAHAAWELVSAGAEVAEQTVAAVLAHLPGAAPR